MSYWGFEMRTENGWSSDPCGQQDASNLHGSREAAEAERANLATVLVVQIDDLRVTEFAPAPGDREGRWEAV